MASSMVSSRSSLSSSWTATSASRVTRNGDDSTISMPGKSSRRLAAINCSSQTNLKGFGARRGYRGVPESSLYRNQLGQGVGNLDAGEVLLAVCGRAPPRPGSG